MCCVGEARGDYLCLPSAVTHVLCFQNECEMTSRRCVLGRVDSAKNNMFTSDPLPKITTTIANVFCEKFLMTGEHHGFSVMVKSWHSKSLQIKSQRKQRICLQKSTAALKSATCLIATQITRQVYNPFQGLYYEFLG